MLVEEPNPAGYVAAASKPVRIPMSILTGFLGSGKTTLLNNLLRHPSLGQTAVLVNEFGEVGIDNLLIREVRSDVVLLEPGCICCTMRGDLISTLRNLLLRRTRGDVPRFDRIVIETSGLADPAPILHTFITDALMSSRFALASVIATIDAVHGMRQLDDYPEAVNQASMADRVLITKIDIASAEQVSLLDERLDALNPTALRFRMPLGEIEPHSILDAGLWNPATQCVDLQRWLNSSLQTSDRALGSAKSVHGESLYFVNRAFRRHDERFKTHYFTLGQPLSWEAFTGTVEGIIARHGKNLLRLKGVLNIADEVKPVVVQGVQHVLYPAVRLSKWPDDDRRTKLIFITRDISRQQIALELGALGHGD